MNFELGKLIAITPELYYSFDYFIAMNPRKKDSHIVNRNTVKTGTIFYIFVSYRIENKCPLKYRFLRGKRNYPSNYQSERTNMGETCLDDSATKTGTWRFCN